MPWFRLRTCFKQLARWALLVAVWLAGPAHGSETLTLYAFVGHDCPHCEAQAPFLDGLQAQHRGFDVQRFEVSRTREHHDRFRSMAAAHGVDPTAVPTLFVGGRVWVGDGARLREEIAAHVLTCLQHGCPDSAALAESAPPPAVTDSAAQASVPAQGPRAPANDTVIDLPWLGPVDLGLQPLVVSTVLIAFVDGFNPCSIWVLTVLLALVIHSGSRRRILLVGVVYLVVTASIYGLFIAGVFGVLSYAMYLDWVYWLVALFALFFGVVNIKDYFWFQRGLSFTIDPRHKPGMFRRMRALLEEGRSLPALIAATTLMAAGISLIELPCTAGFPVVWSGIAASHALSWGYFALLVLLYLVVYLLIELVIFFTAVITLRVDRFEARQGRILKLVGGLIMLALALVLLLQPTLMQTVGGSLGVFAVALAVGLLIIVVHRRLLPMLGVKLGDDW